MSDAPLIGCRYSPTGITPEQARDARARAWAYVFECFNRRDGQEGGPATAPENAKERIKDDFRAETIISD